MPMIDLSFPSFSELAKWAQQKAETEPSGYPYSIRLMVDKPTEAEEAPYDNEDLTDLLKEALQEVAAHRRGEIELPDARDFLNSLEEIKPYTPSLDRKVFGSRRSSR